MTEEHNDIELIEAYLEGRMSPDEKSAFEVRLLVEPELKEELQLYRKVLNGLQDIKVQKVRKGLSDLDKEIELKEKSSNNSKKGYWFLGLAAIVALAFLIFSKPETPGSFSKAMIPYEPGLPVLMDVSSDLVFDNSMSHFKAGNYGEANNGFERLLNSEPNNDTLLYFIGICKMQISDYPGATAIFKKLKTDSASTYADKGDFLYGLSLYASGKAKDAKIILGRISSNPLHPLCEQAKSILENI